MPGPPLAMCRPTSNSRVTGLPMTALVTSAVTLVTVLFSLFSMDSMLRPDLAVEGGDQQIRSTNNKNIAFTKTRMSGRC